MPASGGHLLLQLPDGVLELVLGYLEDLPCTVLILDQASKQLRQQKPLQRAALHSRLCILKEQYADVTSRLMAQRSDQSRRLTRHPNRAEFLTLRRCDGDIHRTRLHTLRKFRQAVKRYGPAVCHSSLQSRILEMLDEQQVELHACISTMHREYNSLSALLRKAS